MIGIASAILVTDEIISTIPIGVSTASREWWVIPAVSRNAVRLAEVIEQHYFPARSGGGFEVLILNERTMGCSAVALAHKLRLPAARLTALLRELGGPARASAVGGDQDTIAVLDPPADGARDRSIARLVAFVDWLERGEEEEP